jgi:uncharacterized protein
MISNAQREIIVRKLAPYKPIRLGVFGSFARDENKPGSDLDILVEFGERINLLDFIGLEQELSDLLGIKVDLVTEKSLSPYIRPYIEKDLRSIL